MLLLCCCYVVVVMLLLCCCCCYVIVVVVVVVVVAIVVVILVFLIMQHTFTCQTMWFKPYEPTCGEVNGEKEDPSLVRWIWGSHDGGLPVEQVVAHGSRAALGRRISLQIVQFLRYPFHSHFACGFCVCVFFALLEESQRGASQWFLFVFFSLFMLFDGLFVYLLNVIQKVLILDKTTPKTNEDE